MPGPPAAARRVVIGRGVLDPLGSQVPVGAIHVTHDQGPPCWNHRSGRRDSGRNGPTAGRPVLPELEPLVSQAPPGHSHPEPEDPSGAGRPRGPGLNRLAGNHEGEEPGVAVDGPLQVRHRHPDGADRRTGAAGGRGTGSVAGPPTRPPGASPPSGWPGLPEPRAERRARASSRASEGDPHWGGSSVPCPAASASAVTGVAPGDDRRPGARLP